MNIFLCFETAFRVIVDKLAAENLLPKDLDTSRVGFMQPFVGQAQGGYAAANLFRLGSTIGTAA